METNIEDGRIEEAKLPEESKVDGCLVIAEAVRRVQKWPVHTCISSS
jgi:hypothetical protein